MNRAPATHPFVSVIVPVRNGESTIAACLDAILATDYPEDRREILAVDNVSTDATASLIRARPAVHYLHESRRGVSNARNRGIAESRGEILAFLDADCVVEPQWLTELVRPFEEPGVGGVGGNLTHARPTTAAERQAARFLGSWQQFALSSNPAYPITANAAYRRDVIDRIGGFDPDMTRAQDVELGFRFQQHSDLRLAFAERATATHQHRPNQTGFFRQQFGWAYGAGLVGAKYSANGGDPVRPTPFGEITQTGRGLAIVLAARIRGRGQPEWIEDAWFDLIRQVAWWGGMRVGLFRGRRLWKTR